MAQPLELDKLYSPEFSSSGVKPVGPVEIDWNNPLTKGLKLCWLAGNSVDLVTGRQATSTAPTSTTSGYLAADGDGSSSRSVILPEITMETEASFVLNVHRRSDVPSNSDYIFDHDNGTNRTLFYQLSGTSSYEFWHVGGKKLTISASSLLPIDENRNIVFTWKNDDATRYRAYSAGSEVASAIGISKIGVFSFIPHLLERYTSASHLDGTIPYFYYYDRKLSADEVKLLDDNPYQILKPANSNLYLVPTARGGTGITVTPGSGSLTYTGYAPTVSVTNNKIVEVPAGSLTYTGYVPSVTASNHQTVEIPVGSLTYTGYAPSVAVDNNITVEIPVGSLTYTGYAPTVITPVSVEIPVGSLTYTGYAPTIDIAANKIVEVPAGSLTYTGYVPSVAVTENVLISVPAGSLTYIGYAPSILGTDAITVEVPSGSLTYIGYAPSIDISFTKNISFWGQADNPTNDDDSGVSFWNTSTKTPGSGGGFWND
tara:strand:+ start:12001 stop:13455 length:1455 start_codon:yes stop_codon:yes gene_type:complete